MPESGDYAKETRKEFSGTLEGLKKVDRECQALCRDQNSSFVANSPEALRTWSATKQYDELIKKCPTFLSFLQYATATTEIPKTISAGIVTAAGLILRCRSQKANAYASMISLILKKAGAKKNAFNKLNTLHLSTCYRTALRLHEKHGIGYDQQVFIRQNSLKEQYEIDCRGSNDLLPVTSNAVEPETHGTHGITSVEDKSSPPMGYKLGDNVDFKVRARHQTKEHQNMDHHMFNTISSNSFH